MPTYKVVDAPTFIEGNMRQPGEKVEFAGWPGSTLEPVCDVAKRVKEFYGRFRASKRLPRMPDLASFAETSPEAPPKRTDHLWKKQTPAPAPPVEEPPNA